MSSLSADVLARHDAWLRRLVARLVDDDDTDDTDDVLQEVWGRALRQPPREGAALPAWLRTVARRVVWQRRRGRLRRERREREVAADGVDAAADPADVVERAEERQRIARLVLQLQEPFRTTILLRFFEELEPAEIARRMAVPPATVRTRLHRGLAKLRAEIERRDGLEWRSRLALLLLPLPRRAAVASSPPAWAAAVWALPCLLIAGALWMGLGGGSAPPTAGDRAVETTHTPAASLAAEGAAAPMRQALQASSASESKPDASAAGAPANEIRGRVLDFAGHPVPDVPLRVLLERDVPAPIAAPAEPASMAAPRWLDAGTTDSDGRFTVPCATSGREIRAAGRWATLRAWPGGDATVSDALVIVAPRVDAGGVVVDEAGRAMAHADVSLDIDDVAGFPLPVAGTTSCTTDLREKTTVTDDFGRFELDGVPGTPYGDLRVLCHDDRPSVMPHVGSVPLPDHDRYDLRIVVHRAPPSHPRPDDSRWLTFEGVVRDVHGVPVPDAMVTSSMRMWGVGRTDARGRYELAGVRSTAGMPELVAVAPGLPPASITPVVTDPDAKTVHVDLVLPPVSHGLSGRVVDADDHGVAGIVVQLPDATPLDAWTNDRFAEHLDSDPLGAHAVTGADGGFRLTGLLDRPYRLRLLDRSSGYAETSDPVLPGAGPVELRLPRERHTTFEVSVRDRGGRAVPDAEVSLDVVKLRVQTGTGSRTSFLLDDRSPSRTSRDGRVRFTDVPAGEVHVIVRKPGWVVADLDTVAGEGPLEVTLLHESLLRVDAPSITDRQLSLQVFDANGTELRLLPAWRGDRQPSGWTSSVHRGRSMVVGVPETVARARLFDVPMDRVVAEAPVVADPDGITVLSFR